MQIAILAQSLALRLGLRELLNSLPGVVVNADTNRPQDLPDADVLVLTSADDLEIIGEKARPILLLTENIEEAIRVNHTPVWGVLPLDASPQEIAAALLALGEGLCVGSPVLVGGLLERHSHHDLVEDEMVTDVLTRRELEVLQLAAEGMANKQIALALEISEHTVKFHLSSLYAKLGVSSRTEAIRAGFRQGKVVM